MKKPDPTIYDVANEAGVSIATVSRVLNFPHRVNPTTRTTVITAIERLGYIPKAESRARALMGSRRIGVLIPFFTEPSFVQRLRGIASVLNKKDYELVVYPVDSKERSLSYLETLPIRKMLDGLIILSQVFDATITKRLIDNHLETVTIEYQDPNFTSLVISDEKGGELATNYLIEKGYKRIAFIGGQKNPEFGIDPITKRLVGYRKAIAAAGLEIPAEFVNEFVYDHGQILKKLQEFGLPFSIFAATDLQAIALIKEARILGLRIPQDVAIIGFDNIDMAEFFGLTTVHQPLDESGRIAASLLISRLSNPSQSTQHIELPLKIIQRETA
ncbi:MAG: LacI family DNA-binding transcriptional regulator [Anaerolineaceae bacterium]|jgi:LacI family transcriptional regulator|nr:LacI family DNA-binding transcriptional regulator [Anaerolineaceae bacterium]